MKILTIILGCLTYAVSSQTSDKDVYGLIEKAIKENKLPLEVYHKADSKVIALAGKNYVAIQRTKENGLGQYRAEFNDSLNVHFWSGEELFEVNTKYWIRPTSILIDGGTINLEYITVSGPPKTEELKRKCYYGKIRGIKKGTEWYIKKSTFQASGCKLKLTELYNN